MFGTPGMARAPCQTAGRDGIGGPGTPGVLVARRELFANRVPDVPGGGTVAYVNPTEHDFLPEIEHREEGGTPDIVGSIRAGLVFQLKQAVGVDEIQRREERFVREARILAELEHPNICRIHDYVVGAERDFLVLEFVDGVTLGEVIARGPSFQERLAIARSIASAFPGFRPESITTSHSVSNPIDRLLTFDEPTRSARSSKMVILAWT